MDDAKVSTQIESGRIEEAIDGICSGNRRQCCLNEPKESQFIVWMPADVVDEAKDAGSYGLNEL